MKVCLLTGFEPFLNYPKNPTAEVVKALDGEIMNGFAIVGHVLPVTFQEAGVKLIQLIEEVKPDAVVMLGLAAGRFKITPERIAINVHDGAKDNNGVAFVDKTIVEDGLDGYFSTLPIRKMIDTLIDNGFPAEVSNSAGTYVCNHVMYTALHYGKVPSGFIHIPASHELAIIHGNIPSWSQHDLNEAIKICIHCL